MGRYYNNSRHSPDFEHFVLLICPQNGIKHKAAINNSDHWLLTLIAALCFIPFCGHINKHGLSFNTAAKPEMRDESNVNSLG